MSVKVAKVTSATATRESYAAMTVNTKPRNHEGTKHLLRVFVPAELRELVQRFFRSRHPSGGMVRRSD